MELGWPQPTIWEEFWKCSVEEVFGMRVSTSESEAMILRWKTDDLSLQAGSYCPQVKEFKYLWSCEGKMEHEMDRQI